MNYSPCFLIAYFTRRVCVWYRLNLDAEQTQSREKAAKGLCIRQALGRKDPGSWGACPALSMWSVFARGCLLEGELQIQTGKELAPPGPSSFFHLCLTPSRAERST